MVLSELANIKSSAKRAELAKKAQMKNRAARSLMRTNIKKFDAAVLSGDAAAAQEAFKCAVKVIDKSAGVNLIHKNKAARIKSSLALKLNAIG